MSVLYVKDIKHVAPEEKEVIEALKKEIPELVVIADDEIDPDIYLSVRVRVSKADNLIEQIKGLGFACKKLDLA